MPYFERNVRNWQITKTIVPIEHLVNIKVTDEMILDFIPGNLILKDTGVTTVSHVYHSNSKLEKLLNDFLVKSNEDSAASIKRFDVITEEMASVYSCSSSSSNSFELIIWVGASASATKTTLFTISSLPATKVKKQSVSILF